MRSRIPLALRRRLVLSEQHALFPAQNGTGALRNQEKAAVPVRIHIERPACDQLADRAAPERGRPIGANTECREPIVSMPEHRVGALAPQHGDDMDRAE